MAAMNDGDEVSQSDPILSTAYSLIDQAAPYFDLSDTESDDQRDTPGISGKAESRRSKRPSYLSLEPIQPCIPYPLSAIFPAAENGIFCSAGSNSIRERTSTRSSSQQRGNQSNRSHNMLAKRPDHPSSRERHSTTTIQQRSSKVPPTSTLPTLTRDRDRTPTEQRKTIRQHTR